MRIKLPCALISEFFIKHSSVFPSAQYFDKCYRFILSLSLFSYVEEAELEMLFCEDIFFFKSNIFILFLKTFFYVEEAEWALEVMKATGKPVAVCLNISSAGDLEGVPLEKCAVRIAKAGNIGLVLFTF